MHQLIVLGNGFDLECGLKSKFSDFFKGRKPLLKPSEDEIKKKGKSNNSNYGTWGVCIKTLGLTAWDIILCSESGKYWYDIESAIREWVSKDAVPANSRVHSPDHCANIMARLNKVSTREVSGPVSGTMNDLLNPYSPSLPMDAEMTVAKYIYQTTDEGLRNDFSQFRIRSFLFQELKRLEKEFADYLEREINNHLNDYSFAGRELISFLIKDEFFDNLPVQNTSILDFNYTDPLHLPTASWEVGGGFVNIHGNLRDKNLIFGIDGKELMTDPEIVPFTKTYRLLALNDPSRGKLVHTDVNGLSNVTGLIKFYGHSLNPADYSYFQAIFDGVDLYQSHTRLVFYYKPTIEGAQEDTFRKVTDLMDIYGKTLDNKDHGKNLMHKLLLEGRLKVKPYKG